MWREIRRTRESKKLVNWYFAESSTLSENRRRLAFSRRCGGEFPPTVVGDSDVRRSASHKIGG
ncbi:hypothetical protein ACF1DY_37680, partial [Streptomyces albus]